MVLSTGGKGISSGSQLAAAFSPDGSATVAWAKPGPRYEEGGALEVFTRTADGGFGAAQTIAQGAQGLVLATGPAGSAALAWMQEIQNQNSVSYTIHAATRPQAGGPFGPESTISDATHQRPLALDRDDPDRRRDRRLGHQHRRQRRRRARRLHPHG